METRKRVQDVTRTLQVQDIFSQTGRGNTEPFDLN